MVRFQQDLIDQIGQHRSRGVIIDVAALDVLDSFGSRTLRNIAEMARLRGARHRHRRHPARRGLRHGGAGHGHRRRRTPRWTSRRGWPTSTAARPRRRTGVDRPARAMTRLEDLHRDYRAAFLRYLPRRDEAALHSGYELGRSAVAEGVSLLELARSTTRSWSRPSGDAHRGDGRGGDRGLGVLPGGAGDLRHGPARLPSAELTAGRLDVRGPRPGSGFRAPGRRARTAQHGRSAPGLASRP